MKSRNMVWGAYFHDNQGNANIENRLVDTMEEEESKANWESGKKTYILPYVN